MPCNSDHMEPTGRELYSQETAGCLIYVLNSLHREAPAYLSKIVNFGYSDISKINDMTQELCALIQGMSVDEAEAIIWNGRNSSARALANWWQRHEINDKIRIAAEEAERSRILLREKAMSKLTEEELEAIGLEYDFPLLG